MLIRSGREFLLSNFVAGDTVYFFQKMFNDGKLVQNVIHKTTDLYASEDAYDPTSGRRTFAEYFFRNDTLVSRTFYDYATGSPTTAIFYYVGEPGDEYRCAEYKGNTLTNNITYKKRTTGYSVAIYNDTYLREFIMEVPETLNFAHKKQTVPSNRRPVKISPHARYFDLLGRYRHTKIK